MSIWRCICFVFTLATAIAVTDDWKPANAPLMTRWAKDVNPSSVLPEYPRPQLARPKWLNLNGLWQFQHAKSGEKPPFGKTLDRQILVPFPVESALSGIAEQATDVWYRRTFNVDELRSQSERIKLHFGAVDWLARVWVNGNFIGEHRGGYDGFSFDISDALNPSGEQELVLAVWDPSDQGYQPAGKQSLNPRGIWYTPATGIWQTVWLEPVHAVHIENVLFTPDIDNAKVDVAIDISERNVPALASVVIRDPADGGRVVAGQRIKIDPKSASGQAAIELPNPKLWSPDSPHLYDVSVSLDADKPRCDEVQSYFGMRKISLGPDENAITRILFNNEFVFQLGPLDQGYWPDGIYTAPTDEALRYDIEMTKKLGFNMCRKHVKVEPDRWYYWADKLGLLVWQDMPSGDQRIAPAFPDLKRSAQSARQFETELAAMIDGRQNHPSVVIWVIFNEGWGQFDTKRLSEWTKAYDPSRLVIAASGWNDRGTGDIHDLHHYPSPRSPKPDANRAAVNGEYGGLGLAIEGHTWQAKDNWGYQKFQSVDELIAKYEEFMDRVRILKGDPGMSAAVYTQTTDVEIEVNGLLTYDRAMVKGDIDRYRAINQSVHAPAPRLTEVLSTAHGKDSSWRFTFEKPADNWTRPDFDHSDWRSGEAGFGSLKAPNAKVRTLWDQKDIWLRREFELQDTNFQKLLFHIHHDDNVEIYLNGQLVHNAEKWTNDYELVPLSQKAISALRPGKNLLAVHCQQDKGEQYIDLGIVERIDPATEPAP